MVTDLSNDDNRARLMTEYMNEGTLTMPSQEEADAEPMAEDVT